MKTLETKSSEHAGVTPATFPRRKVRGRPAGKIVYPESDGRPMADNTEQYEWIVLIRENLETMFANSPDVFVAADLLWYPERDSKVSTAPDVMVAFGRPKGRRGSYIQREEEDIPPRVVFEILSPSNTSEEMKKKLGFYDRHGVGEYYLYDPGKVTLSGWIRTGKKLRPVRDIRGWRSPELGITFEIEKTGLSIYDPSGQKFTTHLAERQQAEKERQRAEKESRRADMLAAKLKSLGITE